MIPEPLVGFLIYVKELDSEQAVRTAFIDYVRRHDPTDQRLIRRFVDEMSRLSEREVRENHRTGNGVLDAEIVQVDSHAAFYHVLNAALRDER